MKVRPLLVSVVTGLSLLSMGLSASLEKVFSGWISAWSIGLSGKEAHLEGAIKAAKTYLVGACDPTGRFVYAVDSESGFTSPKYNITRHSGAIYSLGEYYRRYPDPDVLAAMRRAGIFLKSNYLRPLASQSTQSPILAVWSNAQETDEPVNATLGAAGLGLVALTEIERVCPGFTPTGDLEALGRFIQLLQLPNGSFYMQYNSLAGLETENEILYYPGEAALGLVSLYELTHSTVWLVSAGRALDYLAKRGQGQSGVQVDHWTLLATAKFLPYLRQSGLDVTSDELIQQAEQICRNILDQQVKDANIPELNDGFETSGRTTPTAIRVEGLVAALAIIPKEQKELRDQIKIAIQRGATFLQRAQIKTGPYVGGMPGAILVTSHPDDLFPDPERTEVRIDYVQHALSAWLGYQRLINQ